MRMRDKKGHFKKGHTLNKGRKRPDVSLFMSNRTVSKATRRRLSKSRTGIVFSEEHRRNLAIARNNRPTILSPKGRRSISKAHKGKRLSRKHIAKLRIIQQNRSVETLRKIGMAHKKEKSNFWKGGITPEIMALRNTFDYKIARRACLKRDHYACRYCGKKEKGLHVHHIKPFSKYPKLRENLNNLLTLCAECHRNET